MRFLGGGRRKKRGLLSQMIDGYGLGQADNDISRRCERNDRQKPLCKLLRIDR